MENPHVIGANRSPDFVWQLSLVFALPNPMLERGWFEPMLPISVHQAPITKQFLAALRENF
jgi:hypothetical protein